MKKYIVLGIVLLLILGIGFIIRENQTTYTSGGESTPGPKTSEITRSIALSEVAKHKTKTDCWTAIEGSVYDMTSFISQHPGGDGILKGCGNDATVLFNSIPFHNSAIRDFLTTFKIGILTGM
jgi:hypothetical protein